VVRIVKKTIIEERKTRESETIPQQQQLELLSGFAESKDKNEIIMVLNELFDESKIKLITDLGDDEIKLITAINLIAEMKDLEIWKTGTNLYMSLLLSRKRQSRREVIDAVKGFMDKNIRGLKRLFPNGMN